MKDLPENSPWNERLRQERIRRSWRQREIAEMLGTTTVTVTRWEGGNHLPSAYFRVKLCALFGKSAQELGFVQDNLSASTNKDDTLEAASENLDGASEARPSGNNFTLTSQHPTLPEAYPLERTSWIEPEKSVDQDGHEERKELLVPPQLLSRRKALLLLGAGGFGVATATISAYWLISKNLDSKLHPDLKPTTPLSMPPNRRLHHLLDVTISKWVNHLAWSPDKYYLAVASGTNNLVIWNIEKDVIALVYTTLNKWVNDVSWSKTNWLAAVTAEAVSCSLQLLKFTTQAPAITIKKMYALRSVSLSPDDAYLAISGHSPTVEVWRPFPYRLISQYTDSTLGLLGISRVKWSPSGRFLACAADNGTAHVWEALTGKQRVIYRGHTSRVHDLCWSPDERAIISCSTDQTSQIWDASTGKTLRVYRGQKSEIEGVDWSPHGSWVASASANRTVHVWSPFTGQLIAMYGPYGKAAETPHWSEDGTWLAIGTDEDGVEIWPGMY